MRKSHLRYVCVLTVLLAVLWVGLGIDPHDRHAWMLENALVVLAVGLLAGTYRRFPLSRTVVVPAGLSRSTSK